MNREGFDFLLKAIRRELLVDGDGLGFPRSLNMKGLGKPGYFYPGGYCRNCCIT